MRDFVIMTDSSCDLPVEIVNDYDIKVAPMGLNFDGVPHKHYNDYRELSMRDYYDGMRNGKVGSTAGTNMIDAMDMMRKSLEDNKDIIYLSISSGLSCSYQNACLAADELREEYEDARIEVIDTKSVCLGVGIMVYLAAKKKAAGETYDQILDYLRVTSNNVYHCFMADDLSHLQRSGRISHLTAVVGTALGIKPIFMIGADGKVQTDGKVRGRKAGIKYIVDKAKEKTVDPTIFCVCHADAPDDAEVIKAKLLEAHPDAEIIIGNVGPIIGVNTGVGTLATICISDNR